MALVLAGCSGASVPSVAVAGASQTAQPSLTASAGPSTPSVSPTSPSASTASDTVRLTGAPNFRDLAGDGAGLQLADGRHLARGVVYRSGKLSNLTAADLKALTSLGLVAIFDLRTPDVARRSPDPAVAGADYQLINLFGVQTAPSPRIRTVADARARLRELNVEFVTDPEQRRRLRDVLEQIAAASGPVLIHCTEGKDRTGWVSAMLAHLAGADDQVVLSSYLASNQYRAAELKAGYAARKKADGRAAAELYLAQARVEPQYLQAGLEAAQSGYGGLDGYLRDGVGLTEATIEKLRAKLIST